MAANEEGWKSLLARLVDAARASDDPNTRFRATQLQNRRGPRLFYGAFVTTEGSREIRAPRRDLDELRERRLIRVEEQTRRGNGVSTTQWMFDITEEGYARVDEQRATSAEPTPLAPQGGGRDWVSDVLPVLHAAYVLSGDVNPLAPGIDFDSVTRQLGREQGDARTGSVVIALARTGYIRATIQTDNLPGRSTSSSRRKPCSTWQIGRRVAQVMRSSDSSLRSTRGSKRRLTRMSGRAGNASATE